ncbi:hypothetical protein CIG75_09520 [Tumebacillus algifaecis]|uniref:Uncharacterized protein n=1 Tax=Tumebacillus algifaecis TaxID=1214604 RepID=A0A223D1G1_9BACL|nr:hypothetical protein [Tumebacillus algifaecis]ASS75197.1 hypothetical protein CIG75_09520 [Tumebacillus algifaecis]
MDVKKITRDFFDGYNRIRKKSLWKGCFIEGKDCSTDIIHAHSIQNNKILSKISENGEVLQFGQTLDDDLDFMITMKKEGRKKATTFTGFCGYHDGKVFSPIENHDYIIGNKEQEFLYAYRALAKEYHSKRSVKKISENIKGLLEEGEFTKINNIFKEIGDPSEEHKQFMESIVAGHIWGSEDALDRLESYRIAMNINLNKGRYYKVLTDVIEFDEEYHIAVSSLLNIERDLEGNIVNDLEDFKSHLTPLFFTVFPQSGKTYVLMSYFKVDEHRYAFIKEQILSKDTETQKRIISNLIVKYVENFAASPIRWAQLTMEQQEKINQAFLNTIFEKGKKLDTLDINVFV